MQVPLEDDPMKWDTQTVAKWMSRMKSTDGRPLLASAQIAILKRKKITGANLPSLTRGKLEEWGVQFGPADTLISNIGSLLRSLHIAVVNVAVVLGATFVSFPAAVRSH